MSGREITTATKISFPVVGELTPQFFEEIKAAGCYPLFVRSDNGNRVAAYLTDKEGNIIGQSKEEYFKHFDDAATEQL